MKHSTENHMPHRDGWTAVTLLAVLIITRSGHFGTSFKLPDASWAMFWLAGALTTRWRWPAVLMVAAALVDYFVFTHGVISHGVSGYCVTPAYPFLIPAYLSLWLAGRWMVNSLHLNLRSLSHMTASIVSGVTVAFIISNVSFYVFSDYFATLSAWHYAQDVAHYWPHYLIDTALYAFTGLLIRFIIRTACNIHASHQASP